MDSLSPLAARFRQWFPTLPRDVWILSLGQLLLFIGQGFTLVYAALYFVNSHGFSPTEVGLAQSSMGVSGIFGRIWAGNGSRGRLGLKGILVLAAVITGGGSFCLAGATTFWGLVAGNLLLGLGIGLYWPANLALTTDLTTRAQRSEAMALARLSDNLGIGLGVLIAGQYIARVDGAYAALFIAKGIACLALAVVTAIALAPSPVPATDAPQSTWPQWGQALSDRRLLLMLSSGIFVTTYVAQVSSTVPLYLANFVPSGNTATGFSEAVISYCFIWHATLKIILQMPLVRWLRNTSPVTVMLGGVGLWILGLVLLWGVGILPSGGLLVTLLAFALISLSEILFSPFASTFIGDIAPVDLRGIYFALESQIWALGFVVGPILGGWALDHPDTLGSKFWLALAATATIAIGLLIKLGNEVESAQLEVTQADPAIATTASEVSPSTPST